MDPDQSPLWCSFIWKADSQDLVEIDPFHIKSWGMQRSVDNMNKPIYIVWLNIGNPQPLTNAYHEIEDAIAELDRIRNAKVRH